MVDMTNRPDVHMRLGPLELLLCDGCPLLPRVHEEGAGGDYSPRARPTISVAILCGTA